MTLDSELRATVEALVGKPVPEWQWLIAEKLMTQTECDHPPDAIMWNPWNLVIQCHRCGRIIDALPQHQHQWSDWITGMVAEHRYCLCGEAETR